MRGSTGVPRLAVPARRGFTLAGGDIACLADRALWRADAAPRLAEATPTGRPVGRVLTLPILADLAVLGPVALALFAALACATGLLALAASLCVVRMSETDETKRAAESGRHRPTAGSGAGQRTSPRVETLCVHG
jgi:hypothetical protein